MTALLALPLPTDTEHLIETKRNTFKIRPTEPMLSGRPEAVLRAIRLIDELPQAIVDTLADFTSWIPDRNVSEIEGEIVRCGMSYSSTKSSPKGGGAQLFSMNHPPCLPRSATSGSVLRSRIGPRGGAASSSGSTNY